ncbi:MAG: acyl-CoA/acyl-ACP dehydrogenase [Rhodococcus sp.]|nr:acyl-CoA dehydrogenase family protein [Rhodococcus sp. (in: high G+C Gram-positive bacteria)]MBJ7321731.1 acyl-CoA/acyl-ACP dehydrogenase [Rhodococcus sp. (in: high G+C Gram-positive bacteria)]
MTDWVVAAEELRAELLAPDANDVDRSGVIPASHFDALRSGGLYGLAFKSQDPIRTLADTGEVLVSGCLSTAFVWAQHHGTLLRLATSRNEGLKAKYLAALQTGEVRAGVSGSGYASPRKPLVKAVRVADGYAIAGTAPFVTGWNGLTEVIGVTAYDEAAQQQVTFLAQAEDVAGMVSERLELTAAHASHTVRLNFDKLHVPDDMVMGVSSVSVKDGLELSDMDRAVTRLNGALALGTAKAALLELAAMGRTSDVLTGQHEEIRSTLTRAITDRQIDIFAVRAAASRFSVDVANHLASEAGSGAILRGSTPERLLREATFSLVCTTTPEMKTHLLHEPARRYDLSAV